MKDMDAIRERTLAFIESCRMEGVGRYRYSAAVREATLYSSTYAVMTRSLYNDLDSVSDSERREWIDYFQRHQDDDGLYRDPVIYDQGWYAGDPLWCGRMHQTCHVIPALTCLGAVAGKPFAVAREFSDIDRLLLWLGERDWGAKVAWTGNEIMNVGTLLQYARDFHNDERAGRAVDAMLDWLDTHWINPETGVWGALELADPVKRSHAVQAAYHWWPLYFYDGRSIPCVERAIDTVLETQNPTGGFGWGIHNAEEPAKSSACEDIDSIDPLVRMSTRTDYRRGDILRALERALEWVLRNQMDDGGYVFVLDREFEYGHPEFLGERNRGAMFPTWFRTLSIALMGQALEESPAGLYPWRFVRCPGCQFWHEQ